MSGRHGHDPGPARGECRRYTSPEEAFIARTEPLLWSGCLIWTGGLTAGGYGALRVEGKVTLAHRYAWERENGPIPEGMVVDHRYHCVRACCETSHLRLATQRQNVRNRSGAQSNGSTGVRNVTRTRGTFKVQVRAGGRAHGHYHQTLEAAAAEARQLRKELFGEYAGAA